MSANDAHSSDEARQEAERHRQEINETLDALNDKLSHTIEQAEYQINRPLNWVREHPWATIALSVGVGFVLAGSRETRRRPVDPKLLQEMERAYLEGRVDERQNLPTRRWSDWEDMAQHLHTFQRSGLAGLLVSLSQPLVRGAGYGLANVFRRRMEE
jgi:hypothetical protein